jgi:hypothetical protein
LPTSLLAITPSLVSPTRSNPQPSLVGGVITCQDVSATTNENSPVAINVVAHCQYVINGVKQALPLHVKSVTQPPHGSATIDSDKVVTYSPNNGSYGADSFGFTVADPTGSATGGATASMTVRPTNAATTTTVAPSQSSVGEKAVIAYEATVENTASSPAIPTGTVTWSDGGAGGSFSPSSCTLTSSGSAEASCQSSYTAPGKAGSVTVTASYSGDGSHASSKGTAAVSVGQSTTYAISKQSGGLVFQDPLTSTMSQQQLSSQGTYYFSGDASEENANYNYYETSQGLYIGVQAQAPGTYAGYYAEKAFSQGDIFHADLTAPSRTIPGGYYNVGIYVQTGNGDIDYIYCGPQTSSTGTYWGVSEAYSSGAGTASNYKSLYYDSADNQPLSGSCTIVTDGNNDLTVYIDNAMVYSTTSAGLGYTRPLQMYLEVESSYNGAELYGTFSDFYVTTNATMTVTNVPSAATTAELVSQSGTALATATVNSGVATFDLGAYTYPVSATIVLKDGSGSNVASGGPFTIWGGDVYTVS